MVMPVTSFFMFDVYLVLCIWLFTGYYQFIVKVNTFFLSLVLNGMFHSEVLYLACTTMEYSFHPESIGIYIVSVCRLHTER